MFHRILSSFSSLSKSNYYYIRSKIMSNLTSNSENYTVFKQDGSQQFYCRWSIEEDLLLSKAVADYGPHKWTLVSKLIPGRTAVQCSTRWFGALK